MKKLILFLTVCATAALLALPALANRIELQPALTQEPCSFDSKSALYKDFLANYKGDTPKANEAAKKYVACPVDATLEKEAKDAEDKRIAFLNNWIGKFEKANRNIRLQQAMGDKKYAEAIPIGKDILNDEPENVNVTLNLMYAGYALNTPAFDPDTLTYTKKSMQLLESGKSPDKWDRFASKDDALAWGNFIIGTRTFLNSPNEAIPYFLKAASYESTIKKQPYIYFDLGDSYERGPYAKQSADYKEKFGGKDETPESKLALENINQVVDRMIDAYARAVALAGSDAVIKAKALPAVTDWYKFRNKSDTGLTGLNELIAGILSKPLPPQPVPLTSLPTPAPTPASGPGTSTTGAAPATGTSTQGAPAKTTAASTTTAKPAGPTKPKMRRAHLQR